MTIVNEIERLEESIVSRRLAMDLIIKIKKYNRIELDFYDLEYITNKESYFKSIDNIDIWLDYLLYSK